MNACARMCCGGCGVNPRALKLIGWGKVMGVLAACASMFHLLFILLVIFGALWTRRRPFWTTAGTRLVS